jgi:hypothetical protein
MTENVKVEIDLIAGKLGLECPESSVDSILTRLADFLPKFREQAQPTAQQAAHHIIHRVEDEEHKPPSHAKVANGSADCGAKRRSSVAARSASTLEARSDVKNLQLNVDESGLIAWGSLGKDWKKYLWIIEAARIKGVDGLTNGEISYLMDKTFREARAPKVVNNIKQKIKDRFVQPGTVDVDGKQYSTWRILADGSKEVVQTAAMTNA